MGSNFQGIGQENYGKGYKEKGLDYFLQAGLVDADIQGAAQGILNKQDDIDTTSMGKNDTIMGVDMVNELGVQRESMVDKIMSGKPLNTASIQGLLKLQKNTKQVDQEIQSAIRADTERKSQIAQLEASKYRPGADVAYINQVIKKSNAKWTGKMGPNGSDFSIDTDAPGAVDIDSWINNTMTTASKSMALDGSGSALADIVREPLVNSDGTPSIDVYGQQIYAYKLRKSTDKYTNGKALESAMASLNQQVANPDSKVNKYASYMGMDKNAITAQVNSSISNYYKDESKIGAEYYAPTTNPNPNTGNKSTAAKTTAKYKIHQNKANSIAKSTGRFNVEQGVNVAGKATTSRTPDYYDDKYDKDYTGTALEFRLPKSYTENTSLLTGGKQYHAPNAFSKMVMEAKHGKYLRWLKGEDKSRRNEAMKWFNKEGYGLPDDTGDIVPLFHNTESYIKDYDTHITQVTGFKGSTNATFPGQGVMETLDAIISNSSENATGNTESVYLDYMGGSKRKQQISISALKLREYALKSGTEIKTLAPLQSDSSELLSMKRNLNVLLEENYESFNEGNKTGIITLPINDVISYTTVGGEEKVQSKGNVAKITTRLKNSMGSRSVLVFDSEFNQIGTSVTAANEDDDLTSVVNGKNARDLALNTVDVMSKASTNPDATDGKARMLGVAQSGTDWVGVASRSSEGLSKESAKAFNNRFKNAIVFQNVQSGQYIVIDGRNAYEDGNDLGYDTSIPVKVQGSTTDEVTSMYSSVEDLNAGKTSALEIPTSGGTLKLNVTKKYDGTYSTYATTVNSDATKADQILYGIFTKKNSDGTYSNVNFANTAELLNATRSYLSKVEEAMLKGRNAAEGAKIEAELNN